MQREDEADRGNEPGTKSSERAVNHLSKSVVRDTEGAAKQKPHATFCGNRGWATAPGDPVGGRLPHSGSRRRVSPATIRLTDQTEIRTGYYAMPFIASRLSNIKPSPTIAVTQ